MTEREPARLLDEEATPPALRDALRALRDRAPSEASAARISERLHDPPPPSGLGVPLATLAVLGLGALVALYAWPEREPSVAAAPSTPAPAPLAAPPAVAPVALPSAPPAMLVPEQRREQAPKEVATKPVLREPAAPAVEPAGPSPSEPPAVKPAPPRPIAARVPVAGPEVAVPEPEPASAVVPPPSEPMPAPVVDTERPFAEPQDEAGLLYRAKRLSSTDPKAALRLIAVHEASFPVGAFAEERDMLEIQIHQRLGHTATVKRLAASFKQRYPDSVYGVSP